MRGAGAGKRSRQTAGASSRTPQEARLTGGTDGDTEPSIGGRHDVSCLQRRRRQMGTVTGVTSKRDSSTAPRAAHIPREEKKARDFTRSDGGAGPKRESTGNSRRRLWRASRKY